jgi:phage terminase large subunit-like protein
VAKAGRKPTTTETLERRGSWVARKRAKDAQAAAVPAPVEFKPPTPLTDRQLRAVIKKIPGYDPFKGAEAYRFDCKLARKATQFFPEQLRHVKGAKTGQPFILEPWEQAIIANLFGWINKRTGLRRYRKCFILVGKKNGKSPLCAGIIDYLLFEDGEPGAEIYGAASKYDQASLVWTHASGMIRQNAALSARAHVFKGQSKAIEVGQPGDPNYATYKVISSDSLGSHGFNIHAVVIDELHTFQDGDLVDSLEAATGARRQPLIVYITTKDFDRVSVCNEKETYAKSVRDGTLPTPDLEFLPVIYAVEDENANWKDPKVWALANPNLGVSIYLKSLESECKEAVEMPRKENTFKRLHLNMRTAQETKWLSLDTWRACILTPGDPEGRFKPEALAGRKAYVALDLSSTSDITSTCVVFPPAAETEPFLAYWKFYVPADNVEKRVRRDKVPYDVWAKQGFITLTPGNVIDYSYIRQDLYKICESHSVQTIVFDRWGFEALRQQMVGEGVPEGLFVSFGQGFASMSPAMKTVERLLPSKRLLFADNPVVLWMARNIAVQTDAAGNVKPSKEASGEKIDGLVALIMALGAMSTVPEKRGSVYEDRGIRIIGENTEEDEDADDE